MSQTPSIKATDNPAHGHDQIVTERKPDEVFNAELAAEMVKRTDKLQNTEIDFAVRLKQAREFVAWSSHHMRQSWLDWMKESQEIAKEFNMLRMFLDSESKQVITAAKDTRDFFNSPEYMKAHERMLEMIGMLSRFKELQKDGTLDAFADFILKVSVK